MRLQDATEFAPFLGSGWYQALRNRFNVRHVEQFAALLASPDGEVALRRLGVPVDQVWEPTEQLVRASFGVSLEDPGRQGRTKGAAFSLAAPDARLAFGLYARQDPFSGLTFNSPLPKPEKGDGDQRSKRNGYFPPLTPPQEPDALDRLPPSAFVVPVPPPLPAARDQEARGTCVAFTICSMWELMHRRLVGDDGPDEELSPQYLFYRAKQADERERQDGTTLFVALAQARQHGLCRERRCPYRGHHNFGQSYVFEADGTVAVDAVVADARRRRITGATRLAAGSVEAIKRAVVSGRPVGLGVPVFKNAWLGGYSYVRGEVTLPLTDADEADGVERVLDTHEGSHAVCVVGHRDNDPTHPESDRPGGGYVVIRNSWGRVWSEAPTEPWLVPGYGVLPYAYVERYWLDAYAIDALLVDDEELPCPAAKERPAKTRPAARPGRKSGGKKRPKG